MKEPKPRRYTVTRSLRFTREEAERIAALLKGRRFSEFVRAVLFDLPAPPQVCGRSTRAIPMSVFQEKLSLELARIGNNINQISRAVNTAVCKGERLEVSRLLFNILQQLEDLYDSQDNA